MEIISKAAKLLGECGDFTLTSVNEEGYPRTCVLSKTGSEGLRKAWCATGLSGTKTRHFEANPKASLCCWKGGDSITLIGNVTVRTNREIRESMWEDGFIHHFPGGIDDQNYCVLEFAAEEATLWIDGEFVTVGGDKL